MKRLIMLSMVLFVVYACTHKRTTFIEIELSDSKTILFNGFEVHPEYLSEYMHYFLKDLDATQIAQFEVQLKIRGHAELGLVSDVKRELRSVGIRQFEHVNIEKQ